ncbi:hypothetical protein ILUMI_03955 [Ignelater luminosus]|uniref:Uncharacterized protein n=1 Tax=Ignelater luminosus TaxID=2038154 RepID=A0A8K0DFC9_IGNLU|nr:hypothetical protein ILUMI_03955 [Ignelater luminosus]
MNQTKPDFKVFVSDEILDFRTLEGKQKGNSSITSSKTFSHNVINFENKSEPPNERQISTLEKFAKTLYNSTSPAHQKLAKRSKQKTRSKTVDPRFRRSRSPSHKITASQSTANLSEISMEQSQTRKKSHSASYLHFSSNRENARIPKNNVGDTDVQESMVAPEQPVSALSSNHEKLQNYENGSVDVKPLHTVTPDNCSRNGDEMEEEMLALDNDECKEEYNASPSPYWNDPRLLEKHSILRKPVGLQRVRSSMTVPIIPRSSSVRSKGVVLCHNCMSYQRDVTEYDADDTVDQYDYSLIAHNPELKQFCIKSEEYSTFALFMALGSITGIFVVSVIGWLIFTHFSWDFGKYFWIGQPSVPEEYGIVVFFKYIGSSAAHGLDFILSKIYRLITLPRSDMLNLNTEGNEPFPVWWQNLM